MKLRPTLCSFNHQFGNFFCLITDTAWKVSKYGVISGPYLPVFSPKTGKYRLHLLELQFICVLSFLHIISNTAWKVSKPNTGKYGPEITPYLDTFHAMRRNVDYTLFHKQHQTLAKNQAKAKQYREAEPLLFEFFFFMHIIIRKWGIF